MMANMIPWAQFRKTYGEAIAHRELVRRRLGPAGRADRRLRRAGRLVFGADRSRATAAKWNASSPRSSAANRSKEAAVELFMKTHGGRSFLHGHLFGDNVHEYLAPCIYEGEGEMLGMAFFKSLVKQHGTRFFEPIGKALAAAGIKKPNPLNPRHAWALRSAMRLLCRGGWLGEKFARKSVNALCRRCRSALRRHVEFACDYLQRSPRTIDRCDAETPAYAGRSAVPHVGPVGASKTRSSSSARRFMRPGKPTKSTRDAADCLCHDLTRKLTRRALRTVAFARLRDWASELLTEVFAGWPESMPRKS